MFMDRGAKMSKPIKITPPFFRIKVINRAAGGLHHEDFACDVEEANSLANYYALEYNYPTYKVEFTGWPLEPVNSKFDKGWK